MGQPLKILASLNYSGRTMTTARRIWNRLTPTRGISAVAKAIARQSQKADLHVRVDMDGLFVKPQGSKDDYIWIRESKHVRRQLSRAGVIDFTLPAADYSKNDVRKLLNILTDQKVEEIPIEIRKMGFLYDISMKFNGQGKPTMVLLDHHFVEVFTQLELTIDMALNGQPGMIAQAIISKLPENIFGDGTLRIIGEHGRRITLTREDMHHDAGCGFWENYAVTVIKICPTEKREAILAELSKYPMAVDFVKRIRPYCFQPGPV